MDKRKPRVIVELGDELKKRLEASAKEASATGLGPHARTLLIDALDRHEVVDQALERLEMNQRRLIESVESMQQLRSELLRVLLVILSSLGDKGLTNNTNTTARMELVTQLMRDHFPDAFDSTSQGET